MSDHPVLYDELLHAISELESPEFLEELSAKLSDEIGNLISDGFSRSQDPYGNAWTARRGRRAMPHPILDKSGEMKGSFHRESNESGVKVHNPVAYIGFHQGGTRFMDARQMLPTYEAGLGNWEEPLRKVANDHFNATMNEVA